MDYKNIPLGTAEQLNVLIEIPQDTRNKYELNEDTGFLQLDFVFRDNLICPFNYGFVPQTRAEDRDPLDAMVLSSFPLASGTIAVVRPIGILKLKDRGEQDNKLLAVPLVDPLAEQLRDIGDLTENQKQKILSFWTEIGKQKHKSMQLEEFFDRQTAMAEIETCRIDKR